MSSQAPGVNARDIRMGTIADAISWVKHTVLVVVATPSGSPERRAKLDELSRATATARKLADGYEGRLSMELKIALRVAEFALARLTQQFSPDPATRAQKRSHPRRRIQRSRR